MKRTTRLHVLLLLLLATTAANAQTTVVLNPNTPRPSDFVFVTIQSSWSDSCVPSSVTTTLEGNRIVMEARVTPCDRGCLTAVTNYTISTTFISPAAFGAYTVEYYTVDCAQRRTLQGTAKLTVTDIGCDFRHSLAAKPDSLRVGEPFELTWCDPSTTTPGSAFTVNFYRVYYSKSPTGPFDQFFEVNRSTDPPLMKAITSDAFIGANYFYVEAHGCTQPPTGPCLPTQLNSNIVNVVVSRSTGCAPGPTTLCLGDGRYRLTTRWRTPSGANGDGRPVQLSDDSGFFWFFNPENIELTVKVLDACVLPQGAKWVFASGMTNVEVELTVVDTLRNVTKTYTNPQGATFQTKLDTNAFVCP